MLVRSRVLALVRHKADPGTKKCVGPAHSVCGAIALPILFTEVMEAGGALKYDRSTKHGKFEISTLVHCNPSPPSPISI